MAADSPRRAGEDPEHARTLAESGEQLPPIVVHRPTMRVIDGMHRLRAASLCGRTDIEVRFVDGDPYGLFHDGEHTPTLKALDRERNVIYLGSLARPASPDCASATC